MERTQYFGVLLVVLVAVASVPAPAVAQQADEPEENVTVAVNNDGSATFAVQFTYDLTEAEQQEAFQDLKADEQAQADLEASFEQRMRSVAAAASNETNRDMTISNVSATMETSEPGDTGVVVLTADYAGFAAVNGDELVVSEPFASGYSADFPVTIEAPDGYTISSVTPDATTQSEASATWDASKSLEGMKVQMNAEQTEETAEDTPGMGVGVAVLGVLGTMLFTRFRG